VKRVPLSALLLVFAGCGFTTDRLEDEELPPAFEETIPTAPPPASKSSQESAPESTAELEAGTDGECLTIDLQKAIDSDWIGVEFW
jgi:hypothetical protein